MTAERRTHRLAVLAAIALAMGIAALAPSLAHAQALWLDRRVPSTIQLEILKPDLDDEDNLSFGTSAWYLSGRMEFSPKFHGVAEVPFANASVEGGGGEGLGWGGGNPYLGIEYGSASSILLGEFGVRLPLAGDKLGPVLIGLYSDTERWSAWFPDATTLRAGVRVRSDPGEKGFWVEGRLAPELMIFEGDGLFGDGESWGATYGAALRYDRPIVRMGLAFSGRANLDNLDMSVGEATLHQLDVAANFLEGHIRPGVSLRLPLDEDLDESIAAVWGVSVAWVP